MKTNVGDTDSMLRLGLGALLVLASAAGFLEYVTLSPAVAAIAGLLGLVLLATGYTRKCPALKAMGTDTLEEESSEEEEDVPAGGPETPEDWEEHEPEE